MVSGHWSRACAKRHINWLELQAVWLTLKHFLPQLQGTAVDVISDNSTTVAYINKVGGTQSPSLCRLALDVWAWCRQHNIYLVASHLSGDRNVLADALSRRNHRHPTEWTLHNVVTRAIFQRWPTPHVDLFASEKNHKLPVFFSIRPSPSSSGVNVLTQNWECLYGYAYPPTALIPRVLRKLRLQPTAQILLVAPFWPNQPWFRQMTSMLMDLQRAISQRDDPLKNAVTGMRYPKPEAMRLTVWPLSANPSLTAAFQQMLLTRQPEPDENQLAGFMVPVLDTTKGGAWTEVWTPLHAAPLKSVAIKTAFLIQLASARRVSWVHSCWIDPSHLRWENGGVRLLPSLLLDKNQSASFTPNAVFLLSLKEHSPDDKVHCPLRALRWYLKLTKPLRGEEKALFFTSKEPYKKASKSTVAGWVKEAISGAYSHLTREQREQMGIRAHDTRGVATTWAATVGVPFEDSMDAAAWSRPQTFARFYLKDLPSVRGRFSRAVMVAAGTASRK